MSEFFASTWGVARPTNLRSPVARGKDFILDTALRFSANLRAIVRKAAAQPRLRVLIVGVEVPGREADMAAVVRGLTASTHRVDVSITRMAPQGKFANVDDAIRAAPEPLSAYDWLVITDDDISFDAGFLDRYLALCDAADLAISQPAHRHASHASFYFSRRRPGSLVRATQFVEIGPLTVVRADAFAELVPFPPSRWCYGIDVIWADIARRRGWKIGIVDGAPVSHLKPVAATYDSREAVEEGAAMLASFGVTEGRREVLLTGEIIVRA